MKQYFAKEIGTDIVVEINVNTDYVPSTIRRLLSEAAGRPVENFRIYSENKKEKKNV